MKEAIKMFNDLLNKNPGPRVGVIECSGDRNVDSAVYGKPTPELLEKAIVEAIKESLDYEDVSIVSAESFDYGYKLDVKIKYKYSQEDEEYDEEIYQITLVCVY